MKLLSLKSKLVVATTLAVLGASHLVVAQPGTAPATTGKANGKGKGKGGRKAKGGLSAKTQARLEAAMGKALTADQKTQLDTASNAHRTAVKAADATYEAETMRITGLTAEQMKAMRKTKKTAAPKA